METRTRDKILPFHPFHEGLYGSEEFCLLLLIDGLVARNQKLGSLGLDQMMQLESLLFAASSFPIEESIGSELGFVLMEYRLIRPLGQGGFGVVWLAFSEASQSHHALKWVSGSQGTLETELSALRHFREVSQRLRSPNLIPVEHTNLLPGALYYTLPLADGAPGNDPTKAEWKPFTLADHIAQANVEGKGMTTEQIISVFEPVARSAAMLNKEGLVHRDIKPANILFFHGEPCLSDIGLLGRDDDSISMRGTPGYMPPSWFVESSGETDMWGLATTLYSLLTGQNPDKMGKARFRLPVGGFDLLSDAEQKEWKRLYKVIDKATDENPLERFLSIEAFATAVSSPLGIDEITHNPTDSKNSGDGAIRNHSSRKGVVGFICGILGLMAWQIPLFGFPVTVTGFVFSRIGLQSKMRGLSIAGIILSSIGMVLTAISMAIGSYLGARGENQLLNSLFNH